MRKQQWDRPPLLDNKTYHEPSVFTPGTLLREARRQRALATTPVPDVCILDPDGDLVHHLRRSGRANKFEAWPCYHTDLDTFQIAGREAGIVGRAVGAPFAVLVAEELFASGCSLLISITSAGQILPADIPPYFVIIDRALRDEGTSYHYAPPDAFAEADSVLVARAAAALANAGKRAYVGASWTTDAPFRETASAIQAAKDLEIFAVEMEAAALYAFGRVQGNDVLCLAQVTNTMGQSGVDFEKGAAAGAPEAIEVLADVIRALRA
jgi:uridine phosphorylase